MNKVSSKDPKNTLYCSFCGKSQHEVRKLIAGPTVRLDQRHTSSDRGLDRAPDHGGIPLE